MTKAQLIILMIPIFSLYLMVIGFGVFVLRNIEGLIEINRLTIWVVSLLVIFMVAVLGTIKTWRQYKLSSK